MIYFNTKQRYILPQQNDISGPGSCDNFKYENMHKPQKYRTGLSSQYVLQIVSFIQGNVRWAFCNLLLITCFGQFALFNFVQCNFQCVICDVQLSLYSWICIILFVQFTLCNSLYAICFVQFFLHTFFCGNYICNFILVFCLTHFVLYELLYSVCL